MTTTDVITYGFAYIGMMTTGYVIGWLTYNPVTWVAKVANRLRARR